MRGWWRFRRPDPETEDLISAYVEGSADAAEEARVRDSFSDDPAGQADADSLRATVALLRSVAPAEAPRSFALQEAPAPMQRPAMRYQWAPAFASAAAAIVVGVLVAGDVTGIVTQRGAPLAEAPAAGTDFFDGAQEAPLMMTAPTVQLEREVIVSPAEAPLEEGPADAAMKGAPPQELAPMPEAAAEAESGEMIERIMELRPGTEATVPADIAITVEEASEKMLMADGAPPGEAEQAVEEGIRPADAPDRAATPPRPEGTPAPAMGIGGGDLAEVVEEDGGFSLPLRELEIAFGAAAAALAAAAWLVLRRRS